jgi:hypothetical protein
MESNGIARVKSVIRKQTETAFSKRPNDVDPTLPVDGKVTYCRLVVNEINSLPEPAPKQNRTLVQPPCKPQQRFSAAEQPRRTAPFF